MARWLSRRIDLTAAFGAVSGGVYGKPGAALASEAAAELLDADPAGRRLGLVLAVPPDATHGVRIAFGDTPASDRHAAFTLVPGAQLDTSQLAPALQPRGAVTAWSGPALYVGEEEPAPPGRIMLDVTEIVPD